MITYLYGYWYDKKRDDFFAYVLEDGNLSNCVYQIDNIQEISDYIKTGVMKHIDDLIGLSIFLKRQKIINDDDIIELDL